ncbi:M1 family aminopeptidase [Roseateles violae]|uniref:Aminopeptidase N n=1 Tax=Roseateles violae TaxID=3058042 RepID=A0ABT8DP74_9BURK|nr:M1 family aminopeptidase [Pelomonas sp. PFR6]MDN3920156.1 M1 family aminopeptidase [Pelomonas sp. PFR6]
MAALAAADGRAQPQAAAYELRLRPDFETQGVSGSERIVLRRREGEDWGRLRWPLNGLRLTALRLEGQDLPLPAAGEDALLIEIPPAWRERRELILALRYEGRPRRGLTFGAQHVYSGFDSCHWMVCDPVPGTKARFTLELLLPQGLRSAAAGEPLAAVALAGGLSLQRWRQQRPEASYLFGFAAGRFHEALEPAGDKWLHYLGLQDEPAALRRKFRDSPRVLAFFADKAGLPLPDARYTQLLLPGSVAQEASSLALIGKQLLDPIEQDESEDWVIVHELAHQWWGNLLTCKDWSHFWLNEGLTVFMTAAWKQQRWGEAAYQRELALARRRWQTAIDAGYDKPLSWAGDYPSLAIRRAIQYSKGALFIDALRRELGEPRFWAGLRRYTRSHAGGSVESRDLQRAMEREAGRSLAELFGRWVY